MVRNYVAEKLKSTRMGMEKDMVNFLRVGLRGYIFRLSEARNSQ